MFRTDCLDENWAYIRQSTRLGPETMRSYFGSGFNFQQATAERGTAGLQKTILAIARTPLELHYLEMLQQAARTRAFFVGRVDPGDVFFAEAGDMDAVGVPRRHLAVEGREGGRDRLGFRGRLDLCAGSLVADSLRKAEELIGVDGRDYGRLCGCLLVVLKFQRHCLAQDQLVLGKNRRNSRTLRDGQPFFKLAVLAPARFAIAAALNTAKESCAHAAARTAAKTSVRRTFSMIGHTIRSAVASPPAKVLTGVVAVSPSREARVLRRPARTTTRGTSPWSRGPMTWRQQKRTYD
ncbi:MULTISPECIES: hypothetical protein [unclassified Rathayibacter]|uniref:hypothetical protein n=1 Tax=unclassified Rathayibacter TaxID=2609250 RepID=UPI000CE7C1E7|nr:MULTISPECIES: hypothetical protein [unclassified Rathayibacter]PPG06307.1 hypothetical protein C5C26_11920 [Rathayibacter sp. AY2B1]PPG73663.1 hypothetical protein C5C59_01005 [Rathayibacter sp. AY1F4]